jgi:hypothetical protein
MPKNSLKRFQNLHNEFVKTNKLPYVASNKIKKDAYYKAYDNFFRDYLLSFIPKDKTVKQQYTKSQNEEFRIVRQQIQATEKTNQPITQKLYNTLVQRLSQIMNLKTITRKENKNAKGDVYLVNVKLYRDLYEKELENLQAIRNVESYFKMQRDIFNGNITKELQYCRPAYDFTFQVKTKDDLEKFNNLFIPEIVVEDNKNVSNKDYHDLNEMLSNNAEYKEKHTFYLSWTVGLKMRIIEKLPDATSIDKKVWIEELVQRDSFGVLPKIFNEYTDYEGSSLNEIINSDKLCPYLMGSFKPFACFYSAIINTYPNLKLRLGSSKRGNTDMSYDSLKAFFKSKGIETPNDYSLSINQAMTFFDEYHISFTAINVENRVIFEKLVDSDSRNKHEISHFQCLIHNYHIYILNNKLKAVKKEIGDVKVSDTYRMMTKSKFSCTINTPEELLNLKVEKGVNINLLYTDDLRGLLFYLINTCKYEPRTNIINGKVQTISYMVNDSWVNIKHVQADDEEVVELSNDNKEMKKVYAETYMKNMNLMKATLLSYNNRSEYNQSMQRNLINNPINPITGSFVDESKVKDYYLVDFSLAYSSILKTLPFIPVLKHFDNFEEYHNEKLVDHYMYNVRFTSDKVNDLLYSNTSERITFGLNLKHYNTKNYKILSVCKVSNFNNNTMSTVIDYIWEDKVLNQQDKKMIFNIAMGCTGKIENSSNRTILFQNIDEAMKIAQENNETEFISCIENRKANPKYCVENKITNPNYDANDLNMSEDPEITDGVFYYLNKNKKVHLKNGFLPVQMLIYDTMRRQLYQMANQLNKQGVKVLGVRTDCLYIDKKIDNIEGYKMTTSRAFGHVKVEQKMNLPKKLITFDKVECAFILKEKPVVQISTFSKKDENRFDSFDKFFNENKHVMLTADLAGAGKSYSIINYAKRNDLKICVLTFPNELKLKTANEFDVDSYTLDRFFGLKMFSDDTYKGVNADEYDIIMFDEIFTYSTKYLQLIADFVDQHPEKQIYATGDTTQLFPIETDVRVNRASYYMDIINGIFPRQLNLKDSKRLQTEEDKNTMRSIKKFIFDNFKNMEREAFVNAFIKTFKIKTCNNYEYRKGTINECFTNESCKVLNTLYNDAEASGFIQGKYYKWYPNMIVKNKCRFKIDEVEYHVNVRYTIKSMDEKNVVFTNNESIPFEKLETNFIPNHALTGFSMQGQSFKQPIIIHDIFHHFVSDRWVWTAITRCTNLSNITINLSKSDYELHYNFKKMIESHEQEDIENNRIMNDYITKEWINDTFNKQNGECAHCGTALNKRCIIGDALNLSVDRTCNAIGHIKNNCVLSCVKCNITKK